MHRHAGAVVSLLVALSTVAPTSSSAQAGASSDPRAVSFAQKAIPTLTGGASITDVTLIGTATWIAGSDTETGNATLKALGTGESRMDLALSGGTRSEVRDASTGIPLGQWTAPNSSNFFAPHNCLTDPVWFFPALSSLAGGQNVAFIYVGQETRNGAVVQHLKSYSTNQSVPLPSQTPSAQQLSTMDFYLDANTLLPSAIVFNSHPDSDPTTNIPIEIDFSNYQAIGGVMVPMRIQRYLQGTLAVDVTVSAAAFNTGLQLSNFAISQ
jgi:hypothetical protein